MPNSSNSDSEKRQRLHSILQQRYSYLRERLYPHELARLERVMESFERSEWPRTHHSQTAGRLGQFSFVTFTLPSELKPFLSSEYNREFRSAIKQIINTVAGSDFTPAFSLRAEYQCQDDREAEFHLHASVSLHRFRVADRAVAKSWGSHTSTDVAGSIEILERLFSAPLFTWAGDIQTHATALWARAMGEIVGRPVSPNSALVHVQRNNDVGPQKRSDRDDVAGYLCNPLKTLRRELEFRYRPDKYDVVLFSDSAGVPKGRWSSGFRRPVALRLDVFVRRFLLLPCRNPARAITAGALNSRSPFCAPLAYASEHGLLDQPLHFFELLGEGVAWDRAAALVRSRGGCRDLR